MHPGLTSKHNEASALVAQMSLAEKVSLCSGRNFWHLQAIERLNIPGVMVTDGPHGLRKQNAKADHVGLNASVPATCFPPACGLASSWHLALLEEIGQALGEQCVAEEVAVLLGPGMNIKRHPLCGRNFEYFSEDPYLTGHLASAMVNGVQSQGVGTSIKHYAVNNQEHGRMYVDAIVDERTLHELYLRGFEIAVKQSQPWTVMCAYNRVNGVYCSEHDELLNQILRTQWGYQGLVVTDWGATNDRVSGVRYGLDLEMPGSGGETNRKVAQAVEDGTLSEALLDQAIVRNVALALLGQDMQRTSQQVQATLDQSAHHQLAKRAAVESAVLLKNEQNLLPLTSQQTIAVIGAFAKRPRYQGAGSSQVTPTQLDNLWDALNELVDPTQLSYAEGYDPKHSAPDEQLLQAAVDTAAAADRVILCIGLPSIYESEGFDRPNMHLPPQHDRLAAAIANANPNVVVVLFNGAPVNMPWIEEVPAVLEGYLGGQAGGSALADLLLGVANPSGKLAETFPLSQQDVLADQFFPGEQRQVQYREGLNVGYRYFDQGDQQVLFPFGHGLSYSQFDYGEIQLEQHNITAGQSWQVSMELTNRGRYPGYETVQWYIQPLASPVFRPKQELRGFDKVWLEPGQTLTLTHTFDEQTCALYDRGHQDWITPAGQYVLRAAASSRDIRQQIELTVQSTQTASAAELKASAPDIGLQTDDAGFTQRLGKTIPAAEASRPFHLNTSLQELDATWLGSRVKQRIVDEFTRNMGGTRRDETLNKMFEEMANHLPLRGIALFSRGKINTHQLQILLAVLNYQPWQALKRWLRARRQ